MSAIQDPSRYVRPARTPRHADQSLAADPTPLHTDERPRTAMGDREAMHSAFAGLAS
jgi:hypothetical protein